MFNYNSRIIEEIGELDEMTNRASENLRLLQEDLQNAKVY